MPAVSTQAQTIVGASSSRTTGPRGSKYIAWLLSAPSRGELLSLDVSEIQSMFSRFALIAGRMPDGMKQAPRTGSGKFSGEQSALAEGDAHDSIYRRGLPCSQKENQLFDN